MIYETMTWDIFQQNHAGTHIKANKQRDDAFQATLIISLTAAYVCLILNLKNEFDFFTLIALVADCCIITSFIHVIIISVYRNCLY